MVKKPKKASLKKTRKMLKIKVRKPKPMLKLKLKIMVKRQKDVKKERIVMRVKMKKNVLKAVKRKVWKLLKKETKQYHAMTMMMKILNKARKIPDFQKVIFKIMIL